PASAGLFIDPRDPALGVPLLYATTGRTGLDVFDLSRPHEPVRLGSWSGAGLADVEVVASPAGRTVYAATEYWFGSTTAPRIVELDAGDLGAIVQRRRFSPGDPPYPGGIPWRVQGLEAAGDYLYVAHSHAGLGILHTCCFTDPPRGSTTDLGEGNTGGELGSLSPYAMDVELLGETILVSDASTGVLSAFDFDPIWRHPEDEL
ncbi:MAG TPA: hypothetical protein VM638_08495, partial [Actinomycetota bacterium]|nr:hypothetical protein [Actinomycetota bacterium]